MYALVVKLKFEFKNYLCLSSYIKHELTIMSHLKAMEENRNLI